jgi:hypothetical protein
MTTYRQELADAVWVGEVRDTLDGIVYKEFLSGFVRYEYSHTQGPEDYYTLTGGTLTWSAAGASGDCIYSGGPTPVTVSTTTSAGESFVRSDGVYTLNTYLVSPPGTVSVVCENGSDEFPGQLQGISVAPYVAPYFYLSDSGTRMEGTYTLGPGKYSWNLTNKLPDLEFWVDDYDVWFPEAGADEASPGNSLTIRARVIDENGDPPDRPADQFRFELEGTSREPGILMNFPLPGTARDTYDLQFLPDANPDAEETAADGQWIEMPSDFETAVTLTSFDYGAWSKVSVKATVDGIEIVGHYTGEPATVDVRIPKRDEDSKIADAWKSAKGAGGLADDSDQDDQPAGDGDAGDGFTLYEEYRGFMENGSRLETSHEKKDLFIRDRLGGRSKQGIALFIAATDLEVHHELTTQEFPSDRIMNGNFSEGAHVVNQHGLVVRRGPDQYTSRAVGGPGLPKDVTEIQVATSIIDEAQNLVTVRTGGTTHSVHRTSEDVTHEIGHAVNVWHHGERDEVVEWSVEREASGAIRRDASGFPVVYESGSGDISIYTDTEPPFRYVPLWLQAPNAKLKAWVGWWRGQHSGDETCFMGYNTANVYGVGVSTATPARYLINATGDLPDYPPKTHFCTSTVGTGVNAPSRLPFPRFGNTDDAATSGPSERGDCLHRICVNDRLGTH